MFGGIYATAIKLSDGTEIQLLQDSIFLLTGPNNSGKSRFLRELCRGTERDLTNNHVVKDVSWRTKGSYDELRRFLESEFNYEHKHYRYNNEQIIEMIKGGKLTDDIIDIFVTYLSTSERLSKFLDRGRGDEAAREYAILNTDEELEIRISDAFCRAFGTDLVLNRTPLGHPDYRITQRSLLPDHKNRLTPNFERWINSQDSLEEQGDGMLSFAAVLVSVLSRPSNCIVVDEPEAFLHPPQVRHLANALANEAPPDTQVIIATHSEDFVKGMLDAGGSRVIISRMVKSNNVNFTKTITPSEVRTFWKEPLLRTSDVLSSMFHDVSVICEGDSDVRFYTSVLESTKTSLRDPDFRFFHCGGKDRIPSIVRALRAVDIPVLSIVDIDALSERAKFKTLVEAQGGDFDVVKGDVDIIYKNVDSRRMALSGPEIKVRMDQIVDGLDKLPSVTKEMQRSLYNLLKEASPWRQLKEVGYLGLSGADAVNAFRNMVGYCDSIGLLINPVGELEGFCRVLGREHKAAWLMSVLDRDIAEDEELREARDFAMKIRKVARRLIDSNLRSIASVTVGDFSNGKL